MANLQPVVGSLPNKSSSSDLTRKIFVSHLNLGRTDWTHLKLLNFEKSNPTLKLKFSKEPVVQTRELMKNKEDRIEGAESDPNLFGEMKNRFLSFKKNKYLEQIEHYQKLAKGQAPKFMAIACGDSRVCPTSILGFEPGEAFVVRNVANLVPPYENGPTETNAALEFAVNSVKVENILVMGHSCCGGIRALMSMHDDVETSSFIGSWVTVGKNARISTKAAASNLAFDQQCRHCEKESINRSLVNLLSYPWIQEKVAQGVLSIHGGYYDFVDCTFEKWTLDYQESMSGEDGEKCFIKDREFWS